MARSKKTRPSARDRILAAASDLFYREGVQNVGIDRIIAESGVAKMSLYNHFKSKDALIEAWLEQRDEGWREWFQATVECLATDPHERILAIFDALKAWFDQADFRGCAFINSTVELANPHHPATQVALVHQQAVSSYILSLVKAADVPEPATLAQQLVLLTEGAIVVAMMLGTSTPADHAKQAASILLAAQSGLPLPSPLADA